MSRWSVLVGLAKMEAWDSVGKDAKCVNLAERLIDIEPLDEGKQRDAGPSFRCYREAVIRAQATSSRDAGHPERLFSRGC